ncbi:hypothetical protein KIPB_004780, partial [Kipferlia bialata]|eukprot:g4780.t1
MAEIESDRYHLDLVPGSEVTGPEVDLSQAGCYMEGTVSLVQGPELRLCVKEATCTYVVDGEERSVTSSDGWHMDLGCVSASHKVIPSDPSPSHKAPELFADMNLKEDLVKGIEFCGCIAPSKVQSLAIEPIVLGHNTVLQASPGTGMTTAVAIGILQRLETATTATASPQALVLTPTRDLAHKVSRTISKIGRLMGVRVHTCVGGTPVSSDLFALRKGVDVIVGTPGRVLDLISRDRLNTKSLKMYCLEEGGQMLSGSLRDQTVQVTQLIPPKVQVVVTADSVLLEELHQFVQDPVKITVERDSAELENISQFYINCSREDYKFETLLDLYKTISVHQAVIFCNT